MISTASRTGQIVRVGLPLTFIASESSHECGGIAVGVQSSLFNFQHGRDRPAPGVGRVPLAHTGVSTGCTAGVQGRTSARDLRR